MTNTEQTTEATAGNKTGEEKPANGARTTELTLRAGKADDAEGSVPSAMRHSRPSPVSTTSPPTFPRRRLRADC